MPSLGVGIPSLKVSGQGRFWSSEEGERLGSWFLPLTADVTTSSKISFTTSWAPSSVPTHSKRHKHEHVGISQETKGGEGGHISGGKGGAQVLSEAQSDYAKRKQDLCNLETLRQHLL